MLRELRSVLGCSQRGLTEVRRHQVDSLRSFRLHLTHRIDFHLAALPTLFTTKLAISF
jgi:hypothetical protein